MSLGAIGAGVQAATSLFNIFSGIGMLNKASKIKPDYYSFNDPRLKGMESQQARDMLGRSQMQVNAMTPGAASRQRQIQSSRAGTQAAIQRGSVDPSMALQAMLASQAQADDQINNQYTMEAQMQQQREANLMGAQGTMISERDKALAEKMGKYQMDMSQKNALMNAGQQSISGGGSALAGTFMGLGAQQQQASYNNKYLGLMEKMYK